MVAHLLFELLEASATCRHVVARALGSTNFALVPGWNIPNRPPTFPLGVETSIVLQIQRLGAMDGCCHESEPLGSTLRILHSILQYIECLDSPLCSIFVEAVRYILRLRPERAREYWRAGLT